MSTGTYAKIQGIKFDALEGIQIVADSNEKSMEDAGKYVCEHADKDTVWIVIPCEYSVS